MKNFQNISRRGLLVSLLASCVAIPVHAITTEKKLRKDEISERYNSYYHLVRRVWIAEFGVMPEAYFEENFINGFDKKRYSVMNDDDFSSDLLVEINGMMFPKTEACLISMLAVLS